MASDWVNEAMAACKNLAIDIRKVRDLVQGATPLPDEAQSLATQLASHVTAMIDATRDAQPNVAEAAISAKTLAIALIQLLTRVAREGVHALNEIRAKLTTLNMALAGKIKALHDLTRDTPSPASNTYASSSTLSSPRSNGESSTLPPLPKFPDLLTPSSQGTTRPLAQSHGAQPLASPSFPSLFRPIPSVSANLAASTKNGSGSIQPGSASIDLTLAQEILKAIKEEIYTLLDAYKDQRINDIDEAMNKLVESCRQLVDLSQNLDPEAKAMVKTPLKKIDKCISKPGLEAGLQNVLKDLHRVVRDIVQRYRDINSGKPLASASTPISNSSSQSSLTSSGGIGPDSPSTSNITTGLSSKDSPSTPNFGGSRGRRANTTATGGAMLEALGEVNKLMGENTKRDPTELLNLDKEIGKGASGSVWKATSKNGQVFAIKMVPLSSKTMQSVIKEIKTMQEIKHPNCLEYFTCYKKESDIWIVMEFCDAGSVLDILVKRNAGLPEPVVAAITRQALAGLRYIHSQQKIHRDIKAGNLLLTARAEVKIADFGTAAEADVRRTTVIGSSFWMAPETLDQRGYDFKADIWSLGITLIEMTEKNPPYFDMQPHQVAQAILHNPAPTLKDPSQFSSEFLEFLRFCLQKDVRKRFSAATLETHQWITNADNSPLFNFLNPPTVSTVTSPRLVVKLNDAEVDKITSNIILPPVNVDLLIGPDGHSHRTQHLSSGAVLDPEASNAKSKKAHSEKRPSKTLEMLSGGRNSRAQMIEEIEAQLLAEQPVIEAASKTAEVDDRLDEGSRTQSPSSSPQSSRNSPSSEPRSKLIITTNKAKEARRNSGKASQGSKGAERVKIFMEGDPEPARVLIEPTQTTEALIHECASNYFANKGNFDELSQYCLFYVNGDEETLLHEEDLPLRIYQAHKKAKIIIHFLFKE